MKVFIITHVSANWSILFLCVELIAKSLSRKLEIVKNVIHEKKKNIYIYIYIEKLRVYPLPRISPAIETVRISSLK